MRYRHSREKRWGFGSAFFFIFASSNPFVAEAEEIFGRFDSQFISEPEPIKTTLDDWGEGFRSGERQWAVTHAELGVRMGGVEVSAISRAQVDLRMNSEAVAYYGQIARKESLREGESVPVAVNVDGFMGNGLRLGYRYQANAWALTGGASLFRTSHLMTGGLDGNFYTEAKDDYSFEANVDYAYYRDVIFDRPSIDRASGMGWAFDIAGEWQVTSDFELKFRAEDLLAKIRWDDTPYTRAKANTDNKSYDEDGYAVFAPTIAGTEGYRDTLYQKLKTRYKTEAVLREGPWSAHLQGQYQFGYGFVGFGAGHRYANGLELKGLFWPKYDTVGVEAEYNGWRAALAVDQLEWRRVQSLSLSLSYGY